MNASRSLSALSGLVLCIALGLFFNRPSAAQPAAAPPVAADGRYRIEIKPNGSFTTVFVIDTQTGQCWYRDTSPDTKGWTDMGSPARKNEQ